MVESFTWRGTFGVLNMLGGRIEARGSPLYDWLSSHLSSLICRRKAASASDVERLLLTIHDVVDTFFLFWRFINISMNE